MLSLPAWLLLSAVVATPSEVDLVVFMAQGCPHCQQLRPDLEQLRLAGYRVQEVDALAHRSTAADWKVDSVPTLVILRDQKEVDRIVGRLTQADILKRLPKSESSPAQPFSPSTPSRSIGSISDATPPAQDQLRNLNRESQVVPASANIPAVQPTPSPVDTQPMTPRDGGLFQAKQKALAATVRLRIESESLQSNGSGTVVWSQNGEALIITCGHIFRDMNKTDQLYVDFYRDGNWVMVPGQVLQFFADKHDIGMVRCALPYAVQPVGINYAEPLAVGSAAFSIGCDRGTPPAIKETQITSLNRYLGEANIEVDGAPIDGRSGGGLFDSKGNLVGICNAADHQENRGIYAGQAQIVYQLQALSLAIPSVSSQQFAELDTTRGQNEWLPQPTSSADVPTSNDDTEVIMIVRDGKNPPREVRVAQPTAELLNWIEQQSTQNRN
jgi:thiol-disulfide isomerase/thioredoxin